MMNLDIETLYQETHGVLEYRAQIQETLKQMSAEEKAKVYAEVEKRLAQEDLGLQNSKPLAILEDLKHTMKGGEKRWH